MIKYCDTGTTAVTIVTFVLFALALFTKGFTHDLFLEAGVLLVSVKLILMGYRTTVYYQVIVQELKGIKRSLNK
jgi:hypothetical protein